MTAQLCSHLNSACAQRPGFEILQFKQEEPDATRGRTLDLAISPRAAEIWVEDRFHSHYDPLVPIECKRLPTPKEREKREYLHTFKATTGGLQRFKHGHHGREHGLAIIIGFVQGEDTARWERRINRWIDGFSRIRLPLWSTGDKLLLDKREPVPAKAALRSTNERTSGLAPVAVRHLWIELGSNRL